MIQRKLERLATDDQRLLSVAAAQGHQFDSAVVAEAALRDLEECQKRRGEGSAVFLDDIPSFRLVASLPYWIGRAQEGMGSSDGARASYRSFVDARAASAGDRLTADARQRLTR